MVYSPYFIVKPTMFDGPLSISIHGLMAKVPHIHPYSTIFLSRLVSHMFPCKHLGAQSPPIHCRFWWKFHHQSEHPESPTPPGASSAEHQRWHPGPGFPAGSHHSSCSPARRGRRAPCPKGTCHGSDWRKLRSSQAFGCRTVPDIDVFWGFRISGRPLVTLCRKHMLTIQIWI